MQSDTGTVSGKTSIWKSVNVGFVVGQVALEHIYLGRRQFRW